MRENMGFWKSLASIGPKMRYVADEAWKISQWLVAATALLVVAQRSENQLAFWAGVLVFSFAAILIAFSAASFIFNGATERVKALGRWQSILFAFGVLMISIYFSALTSIAWVNAGMFLAMPK